MAYPIELTIGTGNKVTVNYQSREVSVSLTYRLERGDTDALAVAREKAPEVVAAHLAAWESVRGAAPVGNDTKPEPIPAPTPTRSASAPTEEANGTANPEAGHGGKIEAASSPAKEPSTKTGARDDEPSTPGQRLALRALLVQSGAGEEGIEESLITRYGCESLDDLSSAQACEWLLELQRAERERVRSYRNKPTQPVADPNGRGSG